MGSGSNCTAINYATRKFKIIFDWKILNCQMILFLCFFTERLALSFNNTFLKSSSAIYFLSNDKLFHVAECKPCGFLLSVCEAGSLKVYDLPDYHSFFVSPKSFNCQIMAPWLWEGHNLIGHRKPLPILIDPNVHPHINILMSGVGKDFTGGPLCIMHFANEMLLQGFRVRWINVDGNGLQRDEFLEHAAKYSYLHKFVDSVEFIYAARNLRDTPISCNPKDLFMATIYFTAYTAHFTAKTYGFVQKNFIYFIQDFEPIFFPHDSDYVEALGTYNMPHFAIYSTPFLQNWFWHENYGQYHYLKLSQINKISFAAEPAIKVWPKLDEKHFSQPHRTRTLIAYARAHADRNAFRLTLESISAAICANVFQGPWQFIGVGALKDEVLTLGEYCGKPTPFSIKANVPEPEYFDIVRTGDLGFSLMISPHPSLPPFDFSAAGLITVTNSFRTKTKEMFRRVSSNFVVVEPFVDSIVKGMKDAVTLSSNISFRQDGAANFNWERSWTGDKCYGHVLFNKIKQWTKMHTSLWQSEST